MDEITLKLTQSEAQSILQLFAELPTRTGVYPLLVKMNEQFEEQLAKKDAPQE